MTHRPLDLATLTTRIPDGVARSTELRAAGVSSSAIEARCRPGGPWQRLLPGVLLLSNGVPTRRQLLMAAIAYAGPGAVITGVDALRAAGIRQLPPPEQVHLLLPAERRVNSHGFVQVERTTRVPDPAAGGSELPFAPVTRAVLDLARRERDAAKLRQLLMEPVRRGLCTVSELRAELDAGSQRGSAAPRAVLRAIPGGVRSLAEGWARRVVRRCPIPEPRWNVPVRGVTGVLLGVVDAWWEEVALAWEVGARSFSVASEGLTAQPARHTALAAKGVVVLRTPPQRLHDDPEGVCRELVYAYRRAARRTRPPVHGLPEHPAARTCSGEPPAS
ncbi:hypothetical protein [Gandjariella thermophila]|uniref:AbiEi antitoxin C-terminal domain-containing protein n=1 Tax=Gandjariella thermophila TaxID=1931992 RepID=A0A4D4JEX7_9PSEU|nr:hypothetical protein [Gandjariella thermophila]GDY33208.1 hypothetical protein GTS_48410 [Gandjariella thermophila]